MNATPKIVESRYNHGITSEIVMTCTVPVEVAIKSEHIVMLLQELASDSMAKVINALGEQFNKDEFAECYSVNDLNEEGILFIENMHYFIKNEGMPAYDDSNNCEGR